MRYEALGEEWELAFPFKVQRELEERYNKGFYGIARMVAPNISGDIDLDKDPVKLLDAIGDVRVGVLVDMLAAGTEGMTKKPMRKCPLSALSRSFSAPSTRRWKTMLQTLLG